LEGRRLGDDWIEANYLLVYADRERATACLRVGRRQQAGYRKTGKGEWRLNSGPAPYHHRHRTACPGIIGPASFEVSNLRPALGIAA